jgi:hypothetical protein
LDQVGASPPAPWRARATILRFLPPGLASPPPYLRPYSTALARASLGHNRSSSARRSCSSPRPPPSPSTPTSGRSSSPSDHTNRSPVSSSFRPTPSPPVSLDELPGTAAPLRQPLLPPPLLVAGSPYVALRCAGERLGSARVGSPRVCPTPPPARTAPSAVSMRGREGAGTGTCAEEEEDSEGRALGKKS